MSNFTALYLALVGAVVLAVLGCALWHAVCGHPRCSRCGRRIRSSRDGVAVFHFAADRATETWYCRKHSCGLPMVRQDRAS